MADETPQAGQVDGEGAGPNISALNALHLDGKGVATLDNAEEETLPDTSEVDGDNVHGFANVQSANRQTFERMVADQANEEGAIPVGDQVVTDITTPTEPDNNVDARFENPFPPAEELSDLTQPEPTAPPIEVGAQQAPVIGTTDVFTILPPAPGEDTEGGTVAGAADPVVADLPEDTQAPPKIADPRSITLEGEARGIEDQPLKLDFKLSGSDLDGGSETVLVKITGAPDGYIFSDADGNPVGTQLTDGSWTFSPDDLEDLWLWPQPRDTAGGNDNDYSGDFSLKVTVTVTESNGDVYSSSDEFSVHVEAVGDTPDLSVDNSAGMENTWIPLHVETTNRDIDGSETVSVYIADLPEGAQLNHGTALNSALTLEDGTVVPAGTWVVSPSDLADLKVRPPTNQSKDFDLRVWSASEESSNGDTAVSGPLTIKVDVGIVDPSVSGQGTGNEDEWIHVQASAQVNAADGTETLTVYLEDLPTGVQLRDSQSGNILTPGTDGRYDVTGKLDRLDVRWNPASNQHSDADISFNLRAVAHDTDVGTGRETPITDTVAPDTSDTVSPVTVVVKAVADTPTLSASAVGVEDKWFDLKINSALVDQDGSETLTVTVSGFPDGAQFNHGTAVMNGGGQPTGTWQLAASDLSDLKIKAPRDSDGDFDLTITATSTEAATGAQLGVKTASTSQTIHVSVFGDADTPTVSVVAEAQHAPEDGFYSLRTAIGDHYAVDGASGEFGSAGLTGSLDGSESLVFRITPLEAGTRLAISADSTVTAGEIVGLPSSGYWQVSAADLLSGKVYVGGAADWSSSNSSDAIHFDIRTVATEADASADTSALNGTGLTRNPVASSDLQRLTLVIDPVSDSASIVASDSGVEDQVGGIAVQPKLTLTDTDGSEHPTGTVTITSSDSDMTTGRFELNGQPLTATVNQDGSYTWSVPASAFTQDSTNHYTLGGLKFFPLTHLAEDASYTVSATTSDNGLLRTLTANGTVTVQAVADAPTLSVHDTAGMENTAIPVSITSGLVDADGSESLSIYVGDVPNGAVLNHGTKLASAVTLEDGTVIPAGTWKLSSADLDGLTVTPPTNVSNDFTLKVWSATTEVRNGDVAVTGPMSFKVDVGIVNPSVSGSASGNEDSWIPVSVSASVNASDGTEQLSVYVEDLSAGAQLRNSQTGQVLTPDGSGRYDVTGITNKLEVRWTTANKDDDISLNLRAVARDVDVGTARETAITDTVAPDSSQAVTPVTVVVKAVADAPTLTSSAVGVEDKWVDFKITTAVTDTDGSESLTVYVTDLPGGVQLSAGTQLAQSVTLDNGTTIQAGSWQLSTGQLSGLKMTNLPTDSDADFTVKVYSVSQETATGSQLSTRQAVTSVNVNVTVFGDADMPTVAVDQPAKTILEDQFYNLRTALAGGGFAVDGDLTEQGSANLTASADGSESLTFRIYPVESGSRLAISSDATITSGEIQTLPASGYWTVTASDLFGGKVYVGGAANWASSTGQSELHFDIRTVSQEADRNANTSSLTGTGLTRVGEAVSDPQRLTLVVTPVADGVTIGSIGTGLEDQSGGIDFKPRFTLADPDGSEHIIGNLDIVSTDADLIGGEFKLNGVTVTPTVDGQGNHVWSIPASALTAVSGQAGKYDLSGLKFFPVANSDNDLTYTVRVTTEDTDAGITMTTQTPAQTMVVKAVADAPTIAVGSAAAGTVTGAEDSRIGLNLSAQLNDTDGSETISQAELWSVDTGWTVGYVNGSGTFTLASDMGGGKWSLDPTKLDQVVLTPPKDRHYLSSDNVTMEFHAWSREGATGSQVQTQTAESSTSFQVVVSAVADKPSLLITHARTDEDNAVKLDIRPTLADTDGSESITVFISGAPTGSTFQDHSGHSVGQLVSFDGNGQPVADANGSAWMFTNAQLSDLYFKPPHDSNLDPTLTVTARSTEASNLSYSETSTSLQVIVRGVSDGPSFPANAVDGSGNLIAAGVEDQVINPGFGSYSTQDIDGSETLSLVIKDIPSGFDIQMTSGNDSYLKYLGGGRWSVDPAHLGDVRFTAPHNYAGTFDVKVVAITTENDGDSAQVEKTLKVTVDADADVPSAGLSASVNEDGWGSGGIPITITASPTDTTSESAEQITQITINVDPTGLPGGTSLELHIDNQVIPVTSGQELVINQGDALWSHYNAATGQFTGLTLHGVPEDWSKDIPVTVTATSTDIDGSTATRTVNGSVVIHAVADDPAVFSADASVAGNVDTSLDVNLQVTLGDTDGSEKLSYLLVSGVPNGVDLGQGFNNGDGTWTIPYDANSPLSVTSHYTGTAHLKIYGVIVDTDPDGGQDTKMVGPVSVDVTIGDNGGTGGGDWENSLATVNPPTIAGRLDTLEDTGFDLSDPDFSVTAAAGTTVSALVVNGVPSGATVNGGYYNFLSGNWTVDPAHPEALTITPPRDFSGILSGVQISAVGVSNGIYSVANPGEVPVDVAPVSDGAGFTLTANAGQAVSEDGGIIPITLSLRESDTDFSESLVDGKLVVTNVPSDAKLFLNGVEQTRESDGTYQLDIADFGGTGSTSLSGLGIQAPAQYSGSFSIGFKTLVADGTASSVWASGNLGISVAAVADTPTITAHAVSGNEDSLIALDVTIATPDLVGANAYGSESLSVVIGGIPTGAVLQGAFRNDDGTWTVKGANLVLSNGEIHLTGVSVLPAQDFSGSFTMTVNAYTIENGNHNLASDSAQFQVTVAGVADVPTIDPQNVTGGEDLQVALNLHAQLIDLDETIEVTVFDVPAGARFTDGSGNAVGYEAQVGSNGLVVRDSSNNPVAVGSGQHSGVWILPQAAVASAHFQGPTNASGTYNLRAQTASHDGTTIAFSNIMAFTVGLAGIADAPNLQVSDLTTANDGWHARGNEDSAIPISFSSSLADTDGSETLSMTIGGAPAGTHFINGSGQHIVASTDGLWHIQSSDISGLKILTPLNFNGDVTLSLTATAAEGTSTATSTDTLLVHVDAVNDNPVASVTTSGQSVAGVVTNAIHVLPDSSLSVTDVDSSHLSGLTISISGGAGLHDTLGLTGVNLGLDVDGNLVVSGTDIQVSYDSSSHSLMFQGDGDFATYSQIAQGVVLSNTTGALDVGRRDFTVTFYDDQGAGGSVQTNANVAADAQGHGASLQGSALGEIRWSADGAAVLGGGTGNDTIVLRSSDHPTSIDGGSGIDQILMQHGNGNPADWLFTIDNDAGTVTATSTSDSHAGFIIHLDQGSTVDTAHSDNNQVVFNGDASGSIQFEDHTIAFNHIDRLLG